MPLVRSIQCFLFICLFFSLCLVATSLVLWANYLCDVSPCDSVPANSHSAPWYRAVAATVSILTCVSRVGMEQCVSVGDKLHLAIEVVQLRSWYGEVHFPLSFYLNPFHFSSHIESAHLCCQGDLPGKQKNDSMVPMELTCRSFRSELANWLTGNRIQLFF